MKRMRRARGGRTLPRSGGGVHEDKKSKKLERQMVDELDDEMANWKQYALDDMLDELEDNADMLGEEFWDDWQFPDLDDDEIDFYDEIDKDLKSKDKEQKDASTG